MNELQIFNYAGNNVRTVEINGVTWWVLKDVCEVLSILNHKEVIARLDEDEVGRFDLPHPQSTSKTLEMLCVNESGLYTVILRSDKPEAKPFKRWITHDVLPQIRKTGSYGVPAVNEERIADLVVQKLKNKQLALPDSTNGRIAALPDTLTITDIRYFFSFSHTQAQWIMKREGFPVRFLNNQAFVLKSEFIEYLKATTLYAAYVSH